MLALLMRLELLFTEDRLNCMGSKATILCFVLLSVLLVVSIARRGSVAFTMSGRPLLRRCSVRLALKRSHFGSTSPTQHLSSATATTANEDQQISAPKRRRPAAHKNKTKKQRAALVTPQSDDLISQPSALQTQSSPIKYGLFQSDNEFRDLGVPPAELRPSATLTTGQCFHWQTIVSDDEDDTTKSAWGSHTATEWIGTLRVAETGESVVVVLRETPKTVWYRTLYAPHETFDVRSFLYSYFRLLPHEKDDCAASNAQAASLKDLYEEWSTQCDRLKRIALCIPGVRIIDQDPFECLVSFLCSSNNNIPRITKILNAIRRVYGDPLVNIASCVGEGKKVANSQHDQIMYSFPSLERLQSRATDHDLRSKCGMGYRAKYLIETMKKLSLLGGEAYLQELRSIKDPIVVQEKLIQFCGVGRKVADCVALFSLLQDDAIPVDVHVFSIAKRDYGADSLTQTTKSLTPTLYKQVGDLFRSRFPSKSGWAHSLLFVAELPSFRPALPDDLLDEMDKFRSQEKAKKGSTPITEKK